MAPKENASKKVEPEEKKEGEVEPKEKEEGALFDPNGASGSGLPCGRLDEEVEPGRDEGDDSIVHDDDVPNLEEVEPGRDEGDDSIGHDDDVPNLEVIPAIGEESRSAEDPRMPATPLRPATHPEEQPSGTTSKRRVREGTPGSTGSDGRYKPKAAGPPGLPGSSPAANSKETMGTMETPGPSRLEEPPSGKASLRRVRDENSGSTGSDGRYAPKAAASPSPLPQSVRRTMDFKEVDTSAESRLQQPYRAQEQKFTEEEQEICAELEREKKRFDEAKQRLLDEELNSLRGQVEQLSQELQRLSDPASSTVRMPDDRIEAPTPPSLAHPPETYLPTPTPIPEAVDLQLRGVKEKSKLPMAIPMHVDQNVEVFSNSQEVWLPGKIKEVRGNNIRVEFRYPDMQPSEESVHKDLPVGSPDVRLCLRPPFIAVFHDKDQDVDTIKSNLQAKLKGTGVTIKDSIRARRLTEDNDRGRVVGAESADSAVSTTNDPPSDPYWKGDVFAEFATRNLTTPPITVETVRRWLQKPKERDAMTQLQEKIKEGLKTTGGRPIATGQSDAARKVDVIEAANVQNFTVTLKPTENELREFPNSSWEQLFEAEAEASTAVKLRNGISFYYGERLFTPTNASILGFNDGTANMKLGSGCPQSIVAVFREKAPASTSSTADSAMASASSAKATASGKATDQDDGDDEERQQEERQQSGYQKSYQKRVDALVQGRITAAENKQKAKGKSRKAKKQNEEENTDKDL